MRKKVARVLQELVYRQQYCELRTVIGMQNSRGQVGSLRTYNTLDCTLDRSKSHIDVRKQSTFRGVGKQWKTFGVDSARQHLSPYGSYFLKRVTI